MGIPKAVKNMLLRPMVDMGIQAYKQGKEDFEKGEFDEKEFKIKMKELISNNI